MQTIKYKFHLQEREETLTLSLSLSPSRESVRSPKSFRPSKLKEEAYRACDNGTMHLNKATQRRDV